jgi:hypothetical protein
MIVPDTAMQIFYQNITFAKGCILEENESLHTQHAKVSRKTGTILMLIGISIIIIGGIIWIVTLLSNQLPQASPAIGLFGYILLWGMGIIFLGICVRYTTD